MVSVVVLLPRTRRRVQINRYIRLDDELTTLFGRDTDEYGVIFFFSDFVA